jgi:hypothetical protein
MKLRKIVLASRHRWPLAQLGVATAIRPGQGAVPSGPVLPHGPLRAQRHAHWANGTTTTTSWSTHAAASTASRSCSKNAKPATTPPAAWNATSASRARTAAPRVFHPWSTGHHLCPDRKGPGRQDPADHHGLWPQRKRRRHHLQVELPADWHLLGGGRRAHPGTSAKRKAAWTSSRARRSRWSTTTARSARSPFPCCRSAARWAFTLQLLPVTAPAWSRRPPGCRCARAARLHHCCGAGA